MSVDEVLKEIELRQILEAMRKN